MKYLQNLIEQDLETLLRLLSSSYIRYTIETIISDDSMQLVLYKTTHIKEELYRVTSTQDLVHYNMYKSIMTLLLNKKIAIL